MKFIDWEIVGYDLVCVLSECEIFDEVKVDFY